MQSKRRKVLILGALVAIWALILFLRQPSEPPARSGSAQPAARGTRATTTGGGIPRLKTELIKAPRTPYPSEVQNIFSSPPPPLPAQMGGPGMQGMQAAPPAPPPPDPFQEEAKQLRYVGFLRAGNSATAFIVRGQEVHTVPVGATVGERFRVLEVQDDGVVLASPAGDKQVRLALTGDSTAVPRAPGAPPPGAPR